MSILAIENDEHLAGRLEKSLKSYWHDIKIVRDTNRALEEIILSPKNYDLIIVDISSPNKKTGAVDFCNIIREKGIKTPILILDKEDGIQDRIEVLESGASDYISKPFSLVELMSKIKSNLKYVIPEIINIDNLKFNVQKKQILVNGKRVNLTQKESEILEYLSEHSNEVVSREMIFDNVWTFDSRSSSNIVDVHVKNLRKKIHRENKAPLIETVWGSGYRFVKK